MTPADHETRALYLVDQANRVGQHEAAIRLLAEAQVHAILSRPAVVLEPFVPPARPARPSQADGSLDFDPTVAAGLRELEKAELDGDEPAGVRVEVSPKLRDRLNAATAELAEPLSPGTKFLSATPETAITCEGCGNTYWVDEPGVVPAHFCEDVPS